MIGTRSTDDLADPNTQTIVEAPGRRDRVKMLVMEGSDPQEVNVYEQRLAKITIGGPQRLTGPIELADYDPAWPDAYRRHATRVAGALGHRACRIEHVGSTSVPGSYRALRAAILRQAEPADRPGVRRE